jgi:hypothetical protein
LAEGLFLRHLDRYFRRGREDAPADLSGPGPGGAAAYAELVAAGFLRPGGPGTFLLGWRALHLGAATHG